MTTVFEMRIRMGGDPRGRSECKALRDELAKLNHPACPDVDWVKVEHWCLALFEENGAELQTACFYTLARGQRHGLEGIAQGVVVLEALCSEWHRLWPTMASVRLDLLEWLFDQLRLLLRSRVVTARTEPALAQLNTELARLHARLTPQLTRPLLTLQALRDQVGNLIQRLERNLVVNEAVLTPMSVMTPMRVAPVVILPPPAVQPRRRRLALCLLVVALIAVLLGGHAWWTWQAGQDREPLLPEPVRLDGLSLFDAGSATLKPGSTKVLINALVGIKAQPGWLIVIAGHTDATGVTQQNLALSHARASAVRDWMQRMGDIADSCFAVQGFAASQPIASNETEAGRTANRRVDIQLVPHAGACEQTALAVEKGQS